MKKILWISDIHLNGIETAEDSKRVIDSFIRFVKSDDSCQGVDLLVISGDIAKSGGDARHYNAFNNLIIENIKNVIPKIQIVCVPGNHDVNWKSAKTGFVDFLVEKSEEKTEKLLKEIKEHKIREDYYRTVFSEYDIFHKDVVGTRPEPYFNYCKVIDNQILIVAFNSAWLSVGNPLDEAKDKLEQRLLNNIPYYSAKNSNNLSFQELGNQSYGFTIPYVKKYIDKLSTEIQDKYSDYFKILVAHHPPNNWLHWEELYKSSSSSKSDFQNFIIDCGIDLILCGHEHLSHVEGGLLFGRSLILHGGMFLDHHEGDYENLWFKILELNGLNYSIKEKWFHYENHSGGVWNEKTQFSVKYKNWNEVCYRNGQGTSPNKRKGEPLSSKELLDRVQPSTNVDMINRIKNLIFQENNVDESLLRGTHQHFYSREVGVKLVVVQNIDDLRLDLEKSWKQSDISYILDSITDEDNHIYVFYTCKISPNTPENLKKTRTLLEYEFDRFKSSIVNLEHIDAHKIFKTQFAIRFES